MTHHKWLNHWTIGPKSKILRFYQVTLQKWLDHWTFGPKSKTHRLYQVTLHKWLDHWTFGPKSKILRFYHMTLHKRLEHWTFGPKSKIHRFYHVTLYKWLDHWTFGPKSKIHRLYHMTLHKRLDHWTFGPKSKIHRLYQTNLTPSLGQRQLEPNTHFGPEKILAWNTLCPVEYFGPENTLARCLPWPRNTLTKKQLQLGNKFNPTDLSRHSGLGTNISKVSSFSWPPIPLETELPPSGWSHWVPNMPRNLYTVQNYPQTVEWATLFRAVLYNRSLDQITLNLG